MQGDIDANKSKWVDAGTTCALTAVERPLHACVVLKPLLEAPHQEEHVQLRALIWENQVGPRSDIA